MSSRDPILIMGGGLGGLTTALALAQRGLPSRVLEGAPEFGAIGYGIQFGPNVFHVLDRIGLTGAVMDKADCPPAVLMRDALTGNELARIPTGASFRARFKHPYIIIHRIDLHNALLDACKYRQEIELVPEAMVTSFEERNGGVALSAADGRTFTGPALVGADGFRSLVRAKLVADGEPRPIGYVAHRTIVPISQLKADVHRQEVVLWGGPGFHIVHYPLRHGTLFNVVAVFRTSTHGERGDVESYRAELQHTYRDAHPAMRDLLAMMDLGRRWQVGDRDPIRHWSKGRVVLLGDAAHPPLQSFAQGACMAIEDGLCLAELIHAAGGDFAGAFRRFEAARILRTARLQLESRALWEFYHAEGIARDVRNETVADWDEAHMYRCLAWLYDGFQTSLEPSTQAQRRA
ncbi:MAG: 3-hydroxybenzoate 6-monooxygenase [Rhizobiales bacterium]|nr:3-hydroxybenzoate 6-monooxygenase [Hyphomicrobiales bacterium]